ncbi:MAG: class I SAM-dependent methyltransferase [Phycisphaerae bacterium]|nr:class I SAM-dependent methyltransferase [Phycisphaerae bacterium]
MPNAKLKEFHNYLAREIREDLSGIVEFERAEGLTPYFRQYYSTWLSDGRRLQRTVNGSITRRYSMLMFRTRLSAESDLPPLVLDVGCGFGSDSLFLAWLGCRVIGVDPSESKIAVCKHRVKTWREFLGNDTPEPEFLCGRLEDIDSLAPGTFSGVFTSECLHHCEPVENTLLAMRTVLSDKGLALIFEANGRNPVNLLKLGRRKKRILTRDNGRYSLYGNENIKTPRRWRTLFRECGFKLESTHYSRHLVNEMIGSPLMDRALCALPGKGLAAIHVSFLLSAGGTIRASGASE